MMRKKEKAIKAGLSFGTGKNIFVLVYRWIVVVSIALLYFISPQKISLYIFLETLAVAIVYNTAVTVKNLRVNSFSRNQNYLILQLDSVMLSLFTGMMGGLNSEVYIIYFFLIAYCAIYDSARKTLFIAIISTILFSAASFLNSGSLGQQFNWKLLLYKDFYIIIFAYGMGLINNQVKQYDQMHKKEFVRARTDKLTGLANRHYFEQKLKDEMEYADTTGSLINVIIFDLDNFKRFNDSYGHLLGDKLLILFSDIIKQNIRNTDVPVRYGGEEFLLLIRDLDLQTAAGVAERIRTELEKQKIQVDCDGIRTIVTVSCGIAQYPKHSGNIREVIDNADKALYYAKTTGKNKVATYDHYISDNMSLSRR